MPPPVRHPSRRSPASRSPSKSPSPDPELVRFLNEQKRPNSPDSEAFRNKRIATSGVFNVKSRHQREKEEAERKQRDEEERQKKAYEEFVLDMQGDDRSIGNSKSGFVHAGSSSSYDPQGRLARSHTAGDPPSAPKSMRSQHETENSFFTRENHNEMGLGIERDIQAPKKDPPGKRLQVMGDFLGELQRNQAEREERLKPKMSSGNSISTLLAQETEGSSKPWDSSDPSSSNVCVLNLPAGVTEDLFGEYFSQYGDVASVKIMWPRNADDLIAPNLRSTKTPGATGFVNFMYRNDAERAYREIEGSEWMGSLLRTGWGKPLKKPAVVYYRQAIQAREHRSITKVGGLLPNYSSTSRILSNRKHRRIREPSPPSSTILEKLVMMESKDEVVNTIQSVASRVKEYGKSFEDMLKEREAKNPLFQFLTKNSGVQYEYYCSLLDDKYEPELMLTPFRDEGDASLYSSDTEEESERERLYSQDRVKLLGKAARRRLEAMLRSITLRRERIARVMLFAIDHAAAAEGVCHVIIESLLQPSTPLSRKLARLYVVSDILHNSSASASNAWRYRSLFETKLERVFLHWRDVANSFSGRIKRESCKEMIRNTLNVWENWLVYENSKIERWRDIINAEI